EEILNALGSPTSQCKRLAKNVKNGAAFHHAGLVSQQRKAVEEAFKKGLIKNVSATPTWPLG
ncbi:ski2-type helicase, partial [Candidatus Haloredivivus sp. G17]